jgi:hypothetical protein
MKRLDLVITDYTDAAPGAHPSLARLLARGHREDAAVDRSASAALARLCGIDLADLAPLALAAEGVEPAAGPWFRADPVHLLAGMHSLTVFDCRRLALAADEAAGLVAALNRHFAGEIEFTAPHPGRWYARFGQPLDFFAPPLDEVAGGIVTPDMITGPDAANLHRLAMEVQMVLHAHPVNDAREAADGLTVNGIWFWGGGQPRRPAMDYGQVLGDDFTARAIAAAAGIPWRPAVELADLCRAQGAALAIVSLGTQAASADAAVFAPLLRALQTGAIAEATLSATGAAGTRTRLTTWRARAFWRG